MKLRIEHEDGSREVIEIVGSFTVVEGQQLDRIRTDAGMEHFFTKDGYYDGWGAAVNENADEIIDAMQAKRRYEDWQLDDLVKRIKRA